MTSARFFIAILMNNRLEIRGISEWGPWDTTRIEWATEPEVDAVLLPVTGDRKVRTPDELEAVLEDPLTDATPARRVWVHERLLETVQSLWERQTKRTP